MFRKKGKAEVTGVFDLEMELDKTASAEDKNKKKEAFVKMEKPIQAGNKHSEK